MAYDPVKSKAYRDRPYVKAKTKAYNKEYCKRPEVKAQAKARRDASPYNYVRQKLWQQKSAAKKNGQPLEVIKKNLDSVQTQETQKNAFEQKFGEGTAFDLDYGKLLIIGLCVYIAFQVS